MRAFGKMLLLILVVGVGVFTGLRLAGESPKEIVSRGQSFLASLATPYADGSPVAVPAPVPTHPPAGMKYPTPTAESAQPAPTAVSGLPTQTLEVYGTDGLGLRVRDQPEPGQDDIVGKLFDGTVLTAQGDYVESDGYTWRRVRLDGWVAGAWLSSRPSIGATVQVRGTGVSGLRVRATPRISTGSIEGKVYDSTTFLVVAGPTQADGYDWYEVVLSGWSAGEFLRQPDVPSTPPTTPLPQDRRFIVLGGVCTSSGDFMNESSWMPHLKRWLASEFDLRDEQQGQPDDQIIEFSYSADSWKSLYDWDDTFLMILDGVKNPEAIYQAYPDATFDIVGYSLGGVVALYFAATSGDSLRVRTNSVITVDSPVGGRDIDDSLIELAIWRESLIPELCPTAAQLANLSSQLDPDLLVPYRIPQIAMTDWQGPHIATVTNVRDRVVPSNRGVLRGAKVFCKIVEAGSEDAHAVILWRLPQWFQDVVTSSHESDLEPSSC